MDWSAFDALSDAAVEAAALADPDAQPMTAGQLQDARRVGLAGSLRLKLNLSREAFAARYRIPIETVRAWERGAAQPDAIAQAYLAVIAADPEGIARRLAEGAEAFAAE